MNNDEIDPRKFDDLIELIAKADNDVIIDNGASTFVPMSHYLISNQIPALLLDMGHELVVHTVITGSQALLDTLNGFVHLIKQFPKEALFVVWITKPEYPPSSEFHTISLRLSVRIRVKFCNQNLPLMKRLKIVLCR